MTELFEDARGEDLDALGMTYHETVERGHGRFETRRCWTLPVPDDLPGRENWKELKTLVLVESERRMAGESTATEETRYHLSSMDADAEIHLGFVRAHWGIENSLHWGLEVAFQEDDSRIRNQNAAENLARIRHLALTLLKRELSTKQGLKTKRLKAGRSDEYLLHLPMTAKIDES